MKAKNGTGMTRSALSIIDDVGVIFIGGDVLYRAIERDYEDHIRKLFDCGLIENLVTTGLIPATKVATKTIENYSFVLEHELIKPVIYPFEWSPEMLRKAAICVLDVNKIANEYGYELKDAHPFNVVFYHGQPMYVDIGSISKRRDASLWIAQEEFFNSYVRILRLVERGLLTIYRHAYSLFGVGMAGADIAAITNRFYALVGRRMTGWILYAAFVYRRRFIITESDIKSRVKWIVVAVAIKRILAAKWLPHPGFNYFALKNRVTSQRLTGKTMWSNYHQNVGLYNSAGEVNLSTRMKWIVDTVKELAPASILELAGNQGALSRTLSQLAGVNQVICADYDYQAVDQLLLSSKPSDRLFMACFDFMADVRESLSRERAVRLKSNLVIALAVTHHLVLTQHYSINAVFEAIKSFSDKYVIIEFMPLGLWNGTTAPKLPCWYCEDWFEREFKKHFSIFNRVQLEENRIAYVGAISE